MQQIGWDDFSRVIMCAGTVLQVTEFPEARKAAWILHIDFGEKIGVRKSSAQITELYTRDELLGRQVIAVINFPAKQIGPIKSECLVTGFARDDGAIVLAAPAMQVPNGARLV